MSSNPSSLIQEKIDGIDRRWRWLKFWEYLFFTAACFCVVWFALELCAWRGILASPAGFYLLAGLFGVGAVLAFLTIAVVVTAKEPRRAWLAARMEKGCPGLLDRLNTLVFLEKLRRPQLFPLKRSIELQAAQVLEEQPVAVRFSPRPALLRLGIFALLLAGIILFDLRYLPFAKLLHPPPGLAAGGKNDTPFELVPGQRERNQAGAETVGGSAHCAAGPRCEADEDRRAAVADRDGGERAAAKSRLDHLDQRRAGGAPRSAAVRPSRNTWSISR